MIIGISAFDDGCGRKRRLQDNRIWNFNEYGDVEYVYGSFEYFRWGSRKTVGLLYELSFRRDHDIFT